jgi:hypothetical protein
MIRQELSAQTIQRKQCFCFRWPRPTEPVIAMARAETYCSSLASPSPLEGESSGTSAELQHLKLAVMKGRDWSAKLPSL